MKTEFVGELAWRPATYSVTEVFGNPRELRESMRTGWVAGPFGIDQDAFTVTHLPTGCEIATFSWRETAERFCEAILPLTDWAVADRDTIGANKELEKRIAELIREISAQGEDGLVA